ncbi:YciI family protein [Prolixibacter denitrificans]|uniref:Uncharacterized protein YciI n=1 Tax=Prolixibacter denitrificans TaxID=1541063 RepID=A0A2P8CAN9_9BACT|nr:YciI family protein [Prolixibacter denitrificans]PSK82039.1 uncharacterized protein YciI [Prolixibacter denitrificans]GET22632.1 hypothetical protein JCM18694_28780 [Prolixibacter denitrificans]
MLYFMIEGTFYDPLPVEPDELQKLIKGHLTYLQKGFNEGWILFSGPKAHSGGGVILMKAESRKEVDDFLEEDPFQKAGIQEYHVVEFRFHDGQEGVKSWFS